MTDDRLFDPDRPRARTSDPDTSHEAARSVRSVRESQRLVLVALRHHGPASDVTIRELVERDNPGRRFSESGLRTRRSELVELGVVEDSGRRELLPSGRRAIVWRTV